jgi:hypothetical protein
MRIRAARVLIPLVLLLVVVAFVLIWRARSQVVYGPAVALCPGPDRYGYTCEGAAAYAYIDATSPVALFADDAVARLELPFPFPFYGATYDEVNVGSNGNLQFTTRNPLYPASCLAPAVGLGNVIAPYWADLDLTMQGALETAVIGDAPARVFVVEWDNVPIYGNDIDDRVTFEAQLFENGDIVFLYEDPTTVAGGNGGAAVVGIQSERQGLSLSYSCRQPTLPAPGGLRLAHPAEPNPRPTEPEDGPGNAAPPLAAPQLKGPATDLVAALEANGLGALASLRLRWLGERPARAFVWQAADLTGDAGEEVIAVWSGGPGATELAQVAVVSVADGTPAVLLDRRLATRAEGYAAVTVAEVADLTGDGRADVVLRDKATGATWVLSTATDRGAAADGGAAAGAPALLDVPGRCGGGLVVRDTDGDDRPELIRDGCETPGRLRVVWDGAAFVNVPENR